MKQKPPKAPSAPLQATMLAHLRLRSLTVFVMVIQAGGVTRASEALSLSQPAVTRTIRELEEMVGSPLFRRAGRRRVPTEAGEALFRRARRLIAEVRATAEDLEGGEGRVRVGVLLAAAQRLLPEAIRLIKRKAPLVSIRIQDATGDVLAPALAAGELDLVIGRISPYDRRRGFRYEVLYDEPIMICVGPGHPLLRSKKAQPSIGEIARYPWILPPPGVALRQEIDAALEVAGAPSSTDLIESVSFLTNRTLLLSGEWLAFLPASVVAEDVGLGLLRTIPIPFDLSVDPIGMTLRSDDDLSPQALAFADCVRRAARVSARQLASRNR